MRIQTLFIIFLAILGYANSANAQNCQSIAFQSFPTPAYTGEQGTYSVSGNLNGVSTVFWRFNDGQTIVTDSSPVVLFGSGRVSSINYSTPVRTIVEVLAYYSAQHYCTLYIQTYNRPDASIQSISGTRQNGEVLTFTSTLGVDTEFTANATYNWDFGDGQSGQGRTVSHAYNVNGSYTVKLTVSDGNRTDVTTQALTISPNPNLPGQPTIIRPEFLGCQGNTANYLFDWAPRGPQPSNVFEFQIKWGYSSYWGPIYRVTDPFKVVNGLSKNTPYNVRVRGCINNSSSSCGAYRERTIRTEHCSGGGGWMY